LLLSSIDVNEFPAGGKNARKIARLFSDGRFDSGYNTNQRNPPFASIAGRAWAVPMAPSFSLVYGSFNLFDGVPGPLTKVGPTGKADPGFRLRYAGGSPDRFLGKTIDALALISDGILALLRSGGSNTNGVPILLLNSDGTIKASGFLQVEGFPFNVESTPMMVSAGDGSFLVPVYGRKTAASGGFYYYQAIGKLWPSRLTDGRDTNLPPVLFGAPAARTLRTRVGFHEPLVLSVATQSATPTVFKWYRDGVLLEGQTNSVFRIEVPKSWDSGLYRLEAVNIAGSATVEIAVQILEGVAPVPVLNAVLVAGDRPLRLRLSEPVDAAFRLEVSSDLNSWLPVTEADSKVTETEFAFPIRGDHLYYRLVNTP
jgi:hypothetical protein